MGNKCKCSHGKESHAPKDLGGCCAMWVNKEGIWKSCPCLEFEDELGELKR
jgi:hypothetical protein